MYDKFQRSKQISGLYAVKTGEVWLQSLYFVRSYLRLCFALEPPWRREEEEEKRKKREDGEEEEEKKEEEETLQPLKKIV